MIVGISLLFLATIALLPLIYGLSSVLSVLSGAPYVSTPPQLFATILELAEPNPKKVFLELGSGVGNLLIPAAKTGMQVRGVEISPLLSLVARIRTRSFKNVAIETGSAYKTDFATADVVYCYLFPGMLKKLEPLFQQQLRPGSIVISHAFQLPTKKPNRTIPRTPGIGPIYIYTY